MNYIKAVWQDVNSIRTNVPLIQNITNFVVMNSTANALLALGASPIMAHAPEEIDELVSMVNAMVINIGTLDKSWIESMFYGAKSAKERGIPVVMDPVGAGATELRTNTAKDLMLKDTPSIVRGNASEILALAGAIEAIDSVHYHIALAGSEAQTRGVDSTYETGSTIGMAENMAQKHGSVIVVTGKSDIITDGNTSYRLIGGDNMMPRVTGLGCMASALIAAFAAINDSFCDAALNAMAVMNAAGASAAAKAQGPGTLQLYLYDELYNLTESTIDRYVTIEKLT